MSKYKFSPWHDGSVKPVHVGVYEVNPADRTRYFSWWNGNNWKGHWATIDRAFEMQHFEYDSSITEKWRGILK